MSTEASNSRCRSIARVGTRLGAPPALALCVVLLVVSVGGLSTASTYQALRENAEQHATSSARAQTQALTASLNEAFDVADTLLDRLTIQVRRHGPDRDRSALLSRMHVLAMARAGVTWISASFPDGTFVGVYRDGDSERGLKGKYSDSDGTRGTSLIFDFDADGRAVQVEETETTYDPRKRSFYAHALREKGRSWTDLYPFLPLLRTGVSRVEAVYQDGELGPELLAVLTVDFDASGLVALQESNNLPSRKELVIANSGSVLASWGLTLPAFEQLSPERALNWSTLTDPVVRAAQAQNLLAQGDQVLTLEVHQVRYRYEQVHVTTLGREAIHLVSLIKEDELFAEAHHEAKHGLILTASVSLLAVLLSLVLSVSIARLRRKRAEAERRAERARDEITELGSYHLVAKIGAGGMAEVYRAHHKLLAREAALKLIKQDATIDEAEQETRRECFFEEARVLASLRSVHTVAVYDFGVAADGRYFLAMELLDGLDLDALVRGHGPQPAGRVADILTQLCDSLAEAHQVGLVHRDVKPANVFLCRMAEWLDLVKVLDFGLTRAMGSTARGLAEGTPGYMAPEQARGESASPASDLYSVGCIGYWLLTGKPPYEGTSPDELMECHLNAPIPAFPEAVRAASPAALMQLITHCLAKRPEHRPSSAEALASAFGRVASECSASFSVEMRTAFWRYRAFDPKHTPTRDLTLPMVSLGPRNHHQRAS